MRRRVQPTRGYTCGCRTAGIEPAEGVPTWAWSRTSVRRSRRGMPGSDSADGGQPAPVDLADDAVFETLFRTHYSELCRFANTIVRAPDVAEEIVQDVFTRLWTVRRTLVLRSSARAWLFTSVRNQSLNHGRRASREITLDAAGSPGATSASDDPSDPLDNMERRHVAARVEQAIATLSPRCREVITLRWMHGLSQREIADTLGITRKAVENNITRGLRTLRNLLDK